MDLMLKIPSSEFDEDVIKTINNLLKGREAEIIITVRNTNSNSLLNETSEQYMSRLERSIKEVEEGNVVTFTMQELEAFIRE